MKTKWKYQTECLIEQINFHDSKIQSIEFSKNIISISLEFFIIDENHPANPYRTAKYCQPGVLRFKGVNESKALVYLDKEQKYIVHPFQQFPLDSEIFEINIDMKSNSYNKYELSGNHRIGWTTWEILAKSFSLSWQEMEQDAWYIANCPEK